MSRMAPQSLSPSEVSELSVPAPVPNCPLIKKNSRSSPFPRLSPTVPSATKNPVPSHSPSREGTGDSPQGHPTRTEITMPSQTNRELLTTALRNADSLMKCIKREPFLTYQDEAHIATQAQAHATAAVAFALMELTDAIRQEGSQR